MSTDTHPPLTLALVTGSRPDDLTQAVAKLAVDFPHAVDPTPWEPSEVDDLADTLGERMKRKQVNYRLPVNLLDRLDAYSDRQAQRTGLPASRTDVVVALLSFALDAAAKAERIGLRPDPPVLSDLVGLALAGVAAANEEG